MAVLGKLNKLKAKYDDKVDFVMMIYIVEAHPAAATHWTNQEARSRYKISNHQGLDDRIEAAKQLKNESGDHWQLLIDNMEL